LFYAEKLFKPGQGKYSTDIFEFESNKKKIPEIWIKSEDDDDDKSSQRDILKK